MKKYFSVVLILLMSLALFGCLRLRDNKDIDREELLNEYLEESSNESLDESVEEISDEEKLINEILTIYPNVEYLDKEEIGSTTTYYFKNDDFEFIATNDSSNPTTHPYGWANEYYCTYFYEMLLFLKPDFENLCEKYEIPFNERSLERTGLLVGEVIDSSKTSFQINEAYHLKLWFDIEKGEEIHKAVGLWKEVENLMSKYYPIEDGEYFNNDKIIMFDVADDAITDNSIVSLYENVRECETIPWNIENYDEIENYMMYQYANGIEMGKVVDDGTRYQDTRPKFINSLYINDELYESEYPIEFVYNPLDDKYYTKICFTEKEYKGSNPFTPIYLFQEIVGKYYQPVNYGETKSSCITTYRVSGTEYQITWDDNNQSLKFEKNRETLDINYYRKICGEVTNVVFLQYISLDDFAMLMKMDIENVDVENGAIYLKTK